MLQHITKLMFVSLHTARGLALLAATVLGTPPAFAQSPSNSLGAIPTYPVAGEPFQLVATYVTFGGTATPVDQTIEVTDQKIVWTVNVQHGSSNTNPALLKAAVTLSGVSAGVRIVEFYTRDRAFPNPNFSDPTLRLTANVDIFALADAPTLVEFYNESRKHYFQTTNPAEIAALDTGLFVGWSRTGESYRVYARPSLVSNSSPLVPVCRYYGLPSAGLDTHFFSAFSFECNAIPTLYPNAWLEENAAAYWVQLPGPVDGTCVAGTTGVYRVFNGLPDVNHRYVTKLPLRDVMVALGWISEGYGPQGVGMCIPL